MDNNRHGLEKGLIGYSPWLVGLVNENCIVITSIFIKYVLQVTNLVVLEAPLGGSYHAPEEEGPKMNITSIILTNLNYLLLCIYLLGTYL